MPYLIAAYLSAMGLVLGLAISLVVRYRKAAQELAMLETDEDSDAAAVAVVARP